MVKAWYRQQVSSKEFKTGLKGAPLWELRNLRATFGLEQRKGQKVKNRLVSVKQELERRKNNV